MDRGTRLFWTIVLCLFGASAFLGFRAFSIRAAAMAAAATLQTGELARLVTVVDGDTVVVTNPAGDRVVVRVVGIKTLEAQGKDPVALHTQNAIHAMEKALENPVRVLVGTPPRDKHGRVLATLYRDDEDVALRLVREGLVLVYTPFPFPAMHAYLSAQTKARAERKGLWADSAATARADALATAWRNGGE